ncbi:MAG: hypothetical protein N3D75_03910 [Candidatus Aenigmarchaeota archaeon]|nr:hypothetical protein [Candidatus Aenigmarchaeota archaeon]
MSKSLRLRILEWVFVAIFGFMSGCNAQPISSKTPQYESQYEYIMELDKTLTQYYGSFFGSCMGHGPYPISLKEKIDQLVKTGIEEGYIDGFDIGPLEDDALKACLKLKNQQAYDTLKQSLAILPLSSSLDIPDILSYMTSEEDLIGREMDRVDVILSGVGIALDFANLDFANPRFLRKLFAGKFFKGEPLIFLREGDRILKYYPQSARTMFSSADEFLEILGQEFRQNERVVVEIGTGYRIADFSHLVEDTRGFYIGFDGSDRVIQSMSKPENVLGYSNNSNVFVGDVLSELKNAGKNVYVQQAMGYGSGLALTLSYLDGTPRWIAVGSDALADLAVARFSGVKGGEVYEKYVLDVYSRTTGRTPDYNDFTHFYDMFKKKQLSEEESRRFLKFKQELVEGLPEYYRQIGLDASVRILTKEETKLLKTSWALRCADVKDTVGFVVAGYR